MGIGSPDLQPPAKVIEAIQQAVVKKELISIRVIKDCPSLEKLWQIFIKITIMLT